MENLQILTTTKDYGLTKGLAFQFGEGEDLKRYGFYFSRSDSEEVISTVLENIAQAIRKGEPVVLSTESASGFMGIAGTDSPKEAE